MTTASDEDNRPIAAEPMDLAEDRESFRPGWTPQAELWNGRYAMVGFLGYLLWDLAGYSIVRHGFNTIIGSVFPR